MLLYDCNVQELYEVVRSHTNDSALNDGGFLRSSTSLIQVLFNDKRNWRLKKEPPFHSSLTLFLLSRKGGVDALLLIGPADEGPA